MPPAPTIADSEKNPGNLPPELIDALIPYFTRGMGMPADPAPVRNQISTYLSAAHTVNQIVHEHNLGRPGFHPGQAHLRVREFFETLVDKYRA